jgi:DNA-binding MarR family transcriptional regulator
MAENNSTKTSDQIGLLAALMHSAKLAEARLDAALDGVGTSVPKWSALKHLVEAGGSLSLGHLAERQSCVKSNVTQLVDRLEAEGLVHRVPDPGDRRIIVAQISEEGRRRYHAGRQAFTEVEESFIDGLSASEREHLTRLLTRPGH